MIIGRRVQTVRTLLVEAITSRREGGALIRWGALALILLLGVSSPARAADPPCPDPDNDGYVVCVAGCDSSGKLCGDCNNSDGTVHPGAAEICDGKDNNCDGTVDNVPDPHIQQSGIDIHFGFCINTVDGPGDVCKTAGFQVCQTPPGPVTVQNANGFGLMTCVLRPETQIIHYSDESLSSAGSCSDGEDNNCNGVTDIHDPACQLPEGPGNGRCDGLDNDGDGIVDDGFHIGEACSAGQGACLRNGVKVCSADHSTSVCSAVAGPAGKEGTLFSNSCTNGIDDNCNGVADLDDPACASLAKPELCNSIDDNGDGQVDEGFPGLGQPCTSGTGACIAEGTVVCKADGMGTKCDATAGTPIAESAVAGNCHDAVDNDCNGLTDAADVQCAAAFSDLGVTCSLPYQSGRSGMDCQGKNVITFSAGGATAVKADLLALAADGSLLGTIEDVQSGDLAQLGSRNKAEIDTKRNRYKIFAPIPLLRVTGVKDGVEDVAYCGILPYLEVTKPAGETISLSEGKDLAVSAYLPLVNVDTVNIKLDGIDVLSKLGINPVTAFPTGTPLCKTAGSCVFKVPAGCGDGSLASVEISNLRVEGLDTTMVPDARSGVEAPNQVNGLSFTVKGLPAGGHIFYVTGKPLPLPRNLATPCNLDDLADTGQMSAFGIKVTAPTDQQVVATAPVTVTGTVCGGNQINNLSVNGKSVDVTVPAHQTCTAGNGVSSTGECVVHFSENIPEKDLAQAVLGSAANASFKRGSNRVVADALDVLGNRAVNADVVFGLGPVQLPEGAPLAPLVSGELADAIHGALPTRSDLDRVVYDVKTAMTTQINPAFVVGLEETAVQKFFNEKCQGAIDQFSDRARAALAGKSFGTFSFHPDCSCNLDVPIVLETLNFTPTTADPACKVDFKPGVIDVKVNLPDVFIQVGAHDSCTDHGLFGECIARTKVNVTGVTNVKNISFAFTITENQIETKTPPNTDSFTFDWTLLDDENKSAFNTLGHCADGSAHPGRTCYGNKKDSNPPTTDVCGGECIGTVKNPDFNPLVGSPDIGIECWGADICEAVEAIVAFAVDIFTFGLVDGKDLFVDFLGLGFDFDESFFDALKASKPDAMGLDQIKVDQNKVSQAGYSSFTPGPIDVTIQDGGLTVAFGAGFTTTSVDSTVPVTPGPSVTQASTPTVAQAISVGDDVTMLVADDVFNQVFASMKESGKLQSICTSGDGLTVNDLLPAAADGGCDSLGPDSEVGAVLQGICHAIRGADCLALTSDSALKTNTKKGACVGFSTHDCTVFPLINVVAKAACNVTPHRNIHAADGVLLCARQDLDPEFLVKADSTADATVDTDLILDKLNVVFGLDRGNDGYTGRLEDLPGCWGETGDAAADCRFVAACADLTLKTRMGIDSTKCASNQAGFVFSLLQVLPESLDLGVLCSAAAPLNDQNILGHAVSSIVTNAVASHSQAFMPPVCVDNLDLNGVLNFHSSEAKLFGLTTSGASGAGFADYLGITVGLNPK